MHRMPQGLAPVSHPCPVGRGPAGPYRPGTGKGPARGRPLSGEGLPRQKAGLNRAVLDPAPGELRRQLTYKSIWYGSKLGVLDHWFPSSKTCSACEGQDPRLTLADRTIHCTDCGLTIDRDFNAARKIARH
ncbi:zinc ribbon domain-containing protein [Streptomyces sp. NPDC056549]|uniref:zinc ribbon domain-containing protein n=1 Tax=Streptomyces sp. NPDC056549 TaxID=3345864 RepID=UPI0036C5746D